MGLQERIEEDITIEKIKFLLEDKFPQINNLDLDERIFKEAETSLLQYINAKSSLRNPKINFEVSTEETYICRLDNTSSFYIPTPLVIYKKTPQGEFEDRTIEISCKFNEEVGGDKAEEQERFVSFGEDFRVPVYILRFNNTVTELDLRIKKDYRRYEEVPIIEFLSSAHSFLMQKYPQN